MNEQLQQRLLQYLNGLESLADKSGDFLGDQIPQIALEIIRFGAAQHIILLVLFASIAICVEVARRRVVGYMISQSKMYDASDMIGPSACFGIVTIIFIVFSILELLEATKAIVAPRLFLLEYVKTLIK